MNMSVLNFMILTFKMDIYKKYVVAYACDNLTNEQNDTKRF